MQFYITSLIALFALHTGQRLGVVLYVAYCLQLKSQLAVCHMCRILPLVEQLDVVCYMCRILPLVEQLDVVCYICRILPLGEQLGVCYTSRILLLAQRLCVVLSALWYRQVSRPVLYFMQQFTADCSKIRCCAVHTNLTLLLCCTYQSYFTVVLYIPILLYCCAVHTNFTLLLCCTYQSYFTVVLYIPILLYCCAVHTNLTLQLCCTYQSYFTSKSYFFTFLLSNHQVFRFQYHKAILNIFCFLTCTIILLSTSVFHDSVIVQLAQAVYCCLFCSILPLTYLLHGAEPFLRS